MGFIYKVTNNINGKVYVGKTVGSVDRRFLEHKWEANTDAKGRPFHEALVKYGAENFVLETIEEVDNSKLDEREKYWIDLNRSYIGFPDSKGYNATIGGDGTIKEDYSAIVEDYLKTGSKDQTARNMGCCAETVRNACKAFGVETKQKCAGRCIKRISEDGTVTEYSSIRRASEEIASTNKCSPQTVRKRITFLINQKKKKKAYGYYWKSL